MDRTFSATAADHVSLSRARQADWLVVLVLLDSNSKCENLGPLRPSLRESHTCLTSRGKGRSYPLWPEFLSGPEAGMTLSPRESLLG